MKAANRPDLIEGVMGETIPMRGRMIHGKRAAGELCEEGQDYDIHGRVSHLLHFLNTGLKLNFIADYFCRGSRWLEQTAAR
jgi:hypothetical protein